MLVSVYLYLQNKSRVTSLQNCIQILFLIYKHVDVTNQPKKTSSKCKYKSNFLTKKVVDLNESDLAGNDTQKIGGSGRSAAVSSQLRNKYLSKAFLCLILAFSKCYTVLEHVTLRVVCHVLINLNLAKLFGHLCWVIWRLFTS